MKRAVTRPRRTAYSVIATTSGRKSANRSQVMAVSNVSLTIPMATSASPSPEGRLMLA